METSKTYPQIGVRVSAEEKAEIEAAARREDRPVSNFIRNIVLRHIRDANKQAA